MKHTKLIILFISLLLITACGNKTDTTDTIENIEFFEYVDMAVSAEVVYEDNMGSTDELLADFLKIDESDVQEISDVDTEQMDFSLYLYRSPRRSDVLYRLQFYKDGAKDDLSDELKVHAYKYLTTGEPVEANFVITDKEFIEELDEACELIYEYL